MFLEETIESLEAEDDSGLSNDEPDQPSNGLKGKTAQQTSIYQNKPEGKQCAFKHKVPLKMICFNNGSQMFSFRAVSP